MARRATSLTAIMLITSAIFLMAMSLLARPAAAGTCTYSAQTKPASFFKASEATLYGVLSLTTGEDPPCQSDWWFEWGPASNDLNQDSGKYTSTYGGFKTYKIATQADTTYYFRFCIDGVGENAECGNVLSFTQLHVPCSYSATTKAATNVASSSATMSGSASMNGGNCTAEWWYEWGLSAATLDSLSERDTTASSGNLNLPVTGLAASTKYYYKFCLQGLLDDLNKKCGSAMSFTTAPAFYTPPVRIEENNPAVVYSAGCWAMYADPLLSQGEANIARNAACTAEYTFTGSQIDWIAAKANVLGKAKVYVDSTLMQTVDLYSSTKKGQVTAYSQTFPSSGQHTIKIEATGTKNTSSKNKYIVVDAFEYTS